MKSFYITTAIDYVNGSPHLGHAYEKVLTDVIARFRRQMGDQVHFLTGVDEHGQKVQQSARARGIPPQQFTDEVSAEFRALLPRLNVANDDFIRTTEERHKVVVRQVLQQLFDKGEIYKAEYRGFYSARQEQFLQDKDRNPDGSWPEIYGEVTEITESNYFFKLAAFQEALLEHYERHPEAVEPRSAYNEVVSFIKQGLDDISMSRSSVGWGIPLPWDEKQVVYVWFDALLNYITAIGYGQDEAKFDGIWPANVHLVGKDILRFHAVYWPAMLMAAGLPLPEKVFAHGWLLVGGEKMSKSKLTGISPQQITDDFGTDAFRYYFLRAIQFGQDGSFSWEDMAARYTAELANGLGNLASRATAMVGKYREGVLPEPGEYTNADLALQELLVACAEEADAAMLRLDFSGGILRVKEFVDAVNVYVTEQAPWVLAKEPGDAKRLDTVLYTICESLRAIAVLYHAVMPATCEALWQQLGAPEPLDGQNVTTVASWGQLAPGSTVTKGEALFPRLETA